MTLDGFEVLTVRPDFASAPKLVGARANRMVNLSPARSIGFFVGQKPIHTLAHKYVLAGSQIAEMEAFFNERKGRWDTFLVPSWTGELGCGETNLTTSASGAPYLYIDWCDYVDNYGPAEGRLGRHLFVLWDDGTFFTAKVTDVGESVPDVSQRLTLGANLPKQVDPDNSAIVGFLYLARFSSDELELSYAGPGVAECELAFVEQTVSVPEADVA